MARIVILATCWIGYGSFPIVFELFFHSRVGFAPTWDEILLHALAVLGYGTIGSWFYAFTGRKGLDHLGLPLPEVFERLCMATAVSVLFFLLFLVVDY